ncbi:MAG: extracellular solute-binding protein [Treponema sp.]|nr:extracellular solute-binding protein [Treponema sp.]
MKKYGLLALALAVALTILAVSCEKKQNTAGGLTNIELWYGAAVTEAGPPPANWKVLDTIRDELGINLTLSALPSSETDQDVKINAAAAGNTLPDLFMVRHEPFVNIVRVGVVAPVDDLYPLMPVRTSLQYDDDIRGFTTINGKSYGFASPGSVSKNEGMLIRQDWLDKLGLQAPVTLDDYINVMKAFTFNDPDGNGRADTYGYGAFIEINSYEEGLGRRFDPFFGAFGVAGTWNLTKANAGLNVRKPAYYDALVYIKRMVDEKIIDPNWTSYGKDDFRASWKQGRFGLMREQNAAFAAENNYAPFDKMFPKGEWKVIDPPMGPTGKQSVGVYTQAYRIYCISTKAMRAGKGPAIARLLEWMSGNEGYYLLGWGEKGVNYLLDADGVPTVNGLPDPSKGFTMPEMQPYTQLRNMVFYNSEVELLARYPTYTAPTSGKTMSALTVLRDMESRPWTSNIGSDALPAPNADLKRFYEQGVMEFLTGKRVLTRDNWNAWVAEFDKLGGKDWEDSGIAAAEAAGYLR